MDSKHNIASKDIPITKPDISVSIVNYDSTAFLIQCLHSIKKTLNGLIVEILIADNASSDFDPGRVYQIFSNAVITLNQKNKGFAYAQNQNFSLSKAEAFLLLNPDTIVSEGFFHAILAVFKQYQQVAIVAPNVLSAKGKEFINMKKFPTIGYATYELLLFAAMSPKAQLADSTLERTDLRYAECIGGAAFAVRSHIYRFLGGLDQRFFMYFEEVDFCKRVTETLHQKIVLLPDVRVLHYHGRSSIQTDARQTVYYESYYRYFNKHHGFLASLAIRGLIIFNTIARMLRIQIKYFPPYKGWKMYSRKTISTFRLLLWALGLRQSSRDSS